MTNFLFTSDLMISDHKILHLYIYEQEVTIYLFRELL